MVDVVDGGLEFLQLVVLKDAIFLAANMRIIFPVDGGEKWFHSCSNRGHKLNYLC